MKGKEEPAIPSFSLDEPRENRVFGGVPGVLSGYANLVRNIHQPDMVSDERKEVAGNTA